MEENKIKIKNKKEAKKKISSSKNSVKKPIKKTVTKTTKKKSIPKKDIEDKTKTIKTKKIIKKKTTKPKKEEKTELILPKEWQKIEKKKKRVNNIKEKLQESMFVELSKEEVRKKREETKKDLLKKGVFLLVLVFVIGIVSLSLNFIKSNKNLIKKKYKEYNIGEKVVLKDKSNWIVVSKSDIYESKVVLLKEKNIDINKDKKYDNEDKKSFNSENQTIYDVKNKNSVAEYLESTYKKELSKSIGEIKKVRLLTSKEYVQMRETFNYPYEWQKENILAGESLGTWWIEGFASKRVFAVGASGAYKLFKPNEMNYIRPVIEINKSLL